MNKYFDALCVEAMQFAGGEVHDVENLLACYTHPPQYIEKYPNDDCVPKYKANIELAKTVIQAFINRRKLGNNISLKKIREEFGL